MRRSGMVVVLLGAVVLAACGESVERVSSPTAPRFDTGATVVLSGPTNADPNQTCDWTATASGGTGPYTFNWEWNSARGDVSGTVGYSSGFTGHVAGSYIFIVTVTDANNVVAADTLQGEADGSTC